MKIKISGVVNDSIVDGPGIRFTIFTQGCYHKCEGCHNPQTHDPNAGKLVDTDELLETIKNNPLLDGVTFSGGEPFLQAGVLGDLGIKIKDACPTLNIMTYTGYTFEELMDIINKNPMSLDYIKLLTISDYVVDGRFDINKKSLDCKFRGSTNQRILYGKKSFEKKEPIICTEFDNDEK